MKPYFSIIVPCCDVEPYIRECIESVLAQPFQEWECIFAVEESKDATADIVHEYVKRDPRMKVIQGPRSGSPATPRNRALEIATGEYMICLDSDDMLAPGSLKRLHASISARPGADLYPCAMLVRNETTGKDEQMRDNYPPEFSGEVTGPQASLMIGRRMQYPCPMMQLTVYRREFILGNALRCVDGLRHEDSEFTPRALYAARRVVPLHEPFYIYRIRENSVVTASNRTGYFNRDFARIFQSLFAFHAKVSSAPGFDRRISDCWSRQWMTTLLLKWFSRNPVANISRSERLETLLVIFKDGFSDFDTLLANSNIAKKFAGWWVKAFVRFKPLRPIAEAFFTRVYFPLAENRGRR